MKESHVVLGGIGLVILIALCVNFSGDEEEKVVEGEPKQQVIAPQSQFQPAYSEQSQQPIIIQQPSSSSAITDMATGAMIGHMLSGSGRNNQPREVHHYNTVTKAAPKPAQTVSKPLIAKPAIRKPIFSKPAYKARSYSRPSFRTYRKR